MGLTSEGKKFKDILASKTKVLYTVGEIPVGKRPDTEFLVVQNSHLTDLAADADVVLPSTPALESEGTIVDYLGRLKEVKKAVEPAGESHSHAEIFIGLAEAMGVSLKKAKDTDVKKALKTKVKTVFSPFKKEKDLDIDAEKFTEDINRCAINWSRLLWLKETEKGVAA
jgi:predicted molibdopterin-dependent oxidoreductase YjgC